MNIKIGAAEKRDGPDTIYLYISFWAGIKESSINTDVQKEREKLEQNIKNLYDKKFINGILADKRNIASEKNSIYIHNVPENFFFNNKKSFISIELYLHTVNIKNKENKIPLNKRKENLLFKDSLEIGNYIGDKLKQIEADGNLIFSKKQKCF